MEKETLKKYLPLFIAGGIALLAAILYLTSGRGSLDNNTRELEKSSTVEQVEVKENTVVVKCKNGESYEIVYKNGQTDFNGLVYDKCGADGGIAPPNPESV